MDQTLQHNTASKVAPPINLWLTIKAFRKMVNSIKELNSFYLSGRHYGHYISIKDNYDLSKLLDCMDILPFVHGFYTMIWEQLVDFMMEKYLGCPILHRLQIIVLLEEDMQIALK